MRKLISITVIALIVTPFMVFSVYSHGKLNPMSQEEAGRLNEAEVLICEGATVSYTEVYYCLQLRKVHKKGDHTHPLKEDD